MSDWIESGGRLARPRNANGTWARRAGRVMVFLGLMMLVLAAAVQIARARDPDGRYANSPLKEWFDGLRSGKGPCCSDADGSAVSDVDWESKIRPGVRICFIRGPQGISIELQSG